MKYTRWSTRDEVHEMKYTRWSTRDKVHEMKYTRWSTRNEVHEIKFTRWSTRDEVHEMKYTRWSTRDKVHEMKYTRWSTRDLVKVCSVNDGAPVNRFCPFFISNFSAEGLCCKLLNWHGKSRSIQALLKPERKKTCLAALCSKYYFQSGLICVFKAF